MAWHGLGWSPVAFSEIDPFARALLAYRYPDVPNWGDMTAIAGSEEFHAADFALLVGGTPCQAFSVGGLRGGLADPRGNLALVYLDLAARKRPRWIVWENVPGVLSSGGGRDFGAFLGALGQLGYGFGYRVLDARHFGIPQARRRVYVVGHLGDWRRAAAVLFEPEGLPRHPAARRRQGARVASRPERSAGGCDLRELIAFNPTAGAWGMAASSEVAPTLKVGSGLGIPSPPAIAYTVRRDNTTANGSNYMEDVAPTMDTNVAHGVAVAYQRVVRKFLPLECERLQGFEDHWTRIPYLLAGGFIDPRWADADTVRLALERCPDGPRYAALGNSMPVPAMRWLGERIAAVDALAI